MLKNKDLKISILTVLIPLILQLVYIRYISYNVDKEVYGNFILLSSFIYGLSQVFLSIPGQAFSRYYNIAENKTYFINEFRTYLIGVNILSIFIVYNLYLIYKDRFGILIYISIYFLFVLFNNYSLNQNIFLLSLKRGKYFILKNLEASAKYILPLFMYYQFGTLESFIGGIILGYIISFIFLLSYLKETPFKIEFNLQNQKKHFIFAYPILISAIFSWSMSFSDRYFIDYYLTTKEVAIYSILAQFSGFAQILAMIYGIYVNPIILREYEKDKALALKLLKKYLKYFLIVLVTVFIFALLLPKSLLIVFIEKEVVFNEYYYNTFIILVLGVILTVYQTALSMYFVLLKRLDIHAKIFMFAAIVNLGLNFLIPEYGIIAASLSTLTAYLLLNIFIFLWIKNAKI